MSLLALESLAQVHRPAWVVHTGVLIDLMSEFEQAMAEEGSPPVCLVALLQRMTFLCMHQFALQEELMLDRAYPSYTDHKAHHDLLLTALFDVEGLDLCVDEKVSAGLLQLMNSWQCEYQSMNAQWAAFLKLNA